MECQMAVYTSAQSQGAVKSKELNITSHSIFYNLMIVAVAAGIAWSAIGYAIN